MNGTTPDPERPPASEPVWERPWSVEEIRRSSQSWSLAADAGLLQFLQEFSQQTISRTHEIKKQVDGLIQETKATDCRLHNVFNDFLMLSNTQFIENRVYDEEVEEPSLNTEPEKAEQDLYIDRPLPYLIGSKLFMEQEDVGLGELSSEEGSVGSDRGTFVDSEEEKEEQSDEDFANHSDNDQNRHTAQMSEEEDDDDGCDLFADSEKEEEDIEDAEPSTRPKRNRPTSFADELAARIKGDTTSRTDEKQTDEEGNLFAPPELTDEDFLPFVSTSGRKGLFEDEEEEHSDLFTETPKDREVSASVHKDSSFSKPGKKIPAGAVSVILGDADVLASASASSQKEAPKPEQPSSGRSPHVSVTPAGLFDDDDDDDDNFFATSYSKPSLTDKDRSTADIFDGEEGDLFKEKTAALPKVVNHKDVKKATTDKKVTLPSSKHLKPLSEVKTQKGLFSDEEDSEDLFSSQNASKSKGASLLPSKPPTSALLFDDEDEEDNFFGTIAAKKQTSSLLIQNQEKTKLSEPSKKKASALLFSSDEEDQWGITDSQINTGSDSRSKEERRDVGTAQDQESKKAVKKSSLFEEDDEDDLFVVAKDSKKKTQRVSLLFEDDGDSGGFLFGPSSTSVSPTTVKKETVAQAPPSLFRDSEEEKEASFASKSMDKNIASDLGLSDAERAVEDSEKERPLAMPAVEHSDLLSSPLEKGPKGRTKNVLSLFDEEEDKTEDESRIRAPQTEAGKNHSPDPYPKTTGVFQDEELLFSHKLQKDNDPDVDLFSGTKKTRLLEPSAGSLFEDDDDDDLFSSVKSQPLVLEKKKVVKKDHPVSSSKNQKPESIQDLTEKSLWKVEMPQDSSGPAPFKTKEPSTRIGKIQANLVINPATLLPVVAPQISRAKPVVPELAFSPSEPKNAEASVSFDLPAQADTLHNANKSRVKVRGKRRPQTRAARRLAAQESSEAEDTGIPRRTVAQLGEGTISPDFYQQQPKANSRKDSSVAAATLTLDGSPVSEVDRSPFAQSLGVPLEDDLFDSGGIFSAGTGFQSTGRTKTKEKTAEGPASQAGGSKEQSCVFSALYEEGSEDDLFQSVKPKPAPKASTFPLLEDEDDDLFTDQKGKNNDSKSNNHQDVIFKTQDIFEDDIFVTEAIKPSQKTKEKERTLESNLFDDNIDIFADLTVKPKEKSKKKVEAKSIFDDDMDDIFSSGTQAKTTKPKSQSSVSVPEHKVSNIFDDPLNAFGGH
ncbi:PREDICTED: WASH complex subunit FAM21A [Chrysochloris asiatica]|uniref:WASH complex subunit FAM21A n=1 Tax=Chrysochloris asiatica TaxID=185453 RepID=A0A9B0U8K4_CHRAS|nr:PREDICTED: WASH complex subunit FAM21A [Chrysochloris asiatica]